MFVKHLALALTRIKSLETIPALNTHAQVARQPE
jgi:hypothetical protein